MDHDQEKDLADNLNELYQYMMRRLTRGNFYNEKDPLNEVIRMLTELKEAFDRATEANSLELETKKAKSEPQKKGSDKVSLAI
ncbi:MAG: flagellar protein FliS [Candidatus Magnetoglobus multicellularis str. Araruama]|uniref:Flagellar protein FliS n=1 Tax=Candidatus Magnetoglobus multicellularis str. Araruama TaxID=890399 RepID=A0A1V1P8G3_9BACT|nr:MAG: flagellar protein FliS [Candidatus Magnetoglobus multicellularis str. Araruama]